MKNIIIILITLSVFSCKKEEVQQTIDNDCRCGSTKLVEGTWDNNGNRKSWTYVATNYCSNSQKRITYNQPNNNDYCLTYNW